jgi:polysaccharide biosynthesis/export protein
MKKIILLLVFISTSLINSQELDEAYLASLPDSIRDDVLGKMTDRDNFEKPVYRRPSLMISKNYCEDTNIYNDNNVKNLNNTNGNPNNYQSEFNQSEYNIFECIEKSERFGSNFFDMMQSSFMPINEPNFDGSYVLDFGDVLEVQLIGQKNSIDELSIKRDGSINIKGIGKIFISGLTLETANTTIKNKINNAYIGVEAFTTLISVRDIQVLITGNAFNPGIYTLNGNSNMLHALAMAGGIDEEGSYRKIDLIRDDKTIDTLDLYDVFIKGKSGFNQRLRSGDTVLVNASPKLITISGAFERPGVYELKDGETYLDLYNYANKFNLDANKDTLRIERVNKEQVNYINIENINDLASIMPISGDRLNVRAFERKKVTIEGAVNTPGTYVLSKGETLSSLIKKAEGYRSDAYPFAGVLTNERTLEINKKAAERLYNSFVQKLITKGDTLFASESLPFILNELKKSTISGRVMAEFDLGVIEASPELDTNLSDGDKITIPPMTQQVYIFGEVSNAGTIRYKSGQSINEYLTNAGGLLDSADSKNIYVAHPNGEVNRLSYHRIWQLSNNDDIFIYPGSVIYIPRKLIVNDPALVASIWAPIISAFATSITTLSILDNQ